MGTFTLLMGRVVFWLMLTLLVRIREGTRTLMMMKPGLLPEEGNILYSVRWGENQYNQYSSLYSSLVVHSMRTK